MDVGNYDFYNMVGFFFYYWVYDYYVIDKDYDVYDDVYDVFNVGGNSFGEFIGICVFVINGFWF